MIIMHSMQDLKPIQLSRFNQNQYFEGREEFTRNEWINVVLRSVGLNPEILDNPPKEIADKFPSGLRLKLHFLARLIPLVQNNFNYIELGQEVQGSLIFIRSFHLIQHYFQVVKQVQLLYCTTTLVKKQELLGFGIILHLMRLVT